MKNRRDLLEKRFYSRIAGLRLRRTAKGCTAFVASLALTVELDQEATILLSLLDGSRNVFALRERLCEVLKCNVTLAKVDRIVKQLLALGLIQEVAEQERVCLDPFALPEIEGPECVHIQLTDLCNYRCPSCYLILAKESTSVFTQEILHRLLEELAAVGVFQLALGGGEPLMSPHLVPVVRYARELGMLANITTNGSLLTDEILSELCGSIGEIRLSCNDGNAMKILGFFDWAGKVKQAGIALGFNLIVTKSVLAQLREILQLLCQYQPSSIVLIRPKPGLENDSWYEKNCLEAADCQELASILQDLEGEAGMEGLAVDCAFSSLFQNLSTTQRQKRGVQGCSMGERFCVIKWDGEVVPCSHIHDRAFGMGNILDSSFQKIWETRKRKVSVLSSCGQSCHGCKAIALYEQDGLGKDPGCLCKGVPRK